MIKEFNVINNWDNEPRIIKRVICETHEQASAKVKFIYPNACYFLEVKPSGRQWSGIDDYIQNRG